MQSRKKLTTTVISLAASVIVLLGSVTVAYSREELKPLMQGVFEWTCVSILPCGEFDNAGTGAALVGDALTGIGLYGRSFGTANAGVYGVSPNVGVWGDGGRDGLEYGGLFSGFNGVYGYSVGLDGWGTVGRADGNLGIGAYGTALGTLGRGVVGFSDQYIGVEGVSNNSLAGRFISNGFAGLYAEGAPGFRDAVFPGEIYAGTVATNLLILLAINNSGETLAVGDVVVFDGLVTNDGAAAPLLAVRRATGDGSPVIGVVRGAHTSQTSVPAEAATLAPMQTDPTTLSLEVPPVDEGESSTWTTAETAVRPEVAAAATKSVEVGRLVEGNVAPGQQLLIAVQGVAKVNVDASAAPIRVGDTLATSGAGLAVSAATASAEAREDDENSNAREGESETVEPGSRPAAAPTMVVGRALESLEGGSGSIYVLISPH